MKELKKLEKEELYALLLELSSLRKENADFIKLTSSPALKGGDSR